MTEQQITNFFNKVNKTEACWFWLAAKDGVGYGISTANGKTLRAHRVSWLIAYGELPKGKDLHHICENKDCVNPRHLTPLDHAYHLKLTEKNPTTINSKKTHCLRGHSLSGNNLVANKLKWGKRICKTCDRTRRNNSPWRQQHKEQLREYQRQYYSNRKVS